MRWYYGVARLADSKSYLPHHTGVAGLKPSASCKVKVVYYTELELHYFSSHTLSYPMNTGAAFRLEGSLVLETIYRQPLHRLDIHCNSSHD